MSRGLPHVLAGVVLLMACAGWIAPVQRALAEGAACVQAGGAYDLERRQCMADGDRPALTDGPLWLLAQMATLASRQLVPPIHGAIHGGRVVAADA